MELYEQILCESIARDVLPQLKIDYVELIEQRCYHTILQIYQILSDDSIEDPECFQKIEAIVSAFDQLGIGSGGRHDF